MELLEFMKMIFLFIIKFNIYNMLINVFDLETTGVDKQKDQIIQIASLIIDLNNNKIIHELNEYVQPVGNYQMSLGGYFTHGITPEFLKDKPHLKDLAPKIVEWFGLTDAILTYNGKNFDIPFLKIELNRYGYDIDFTKKKCYDAYLEERRRHGMKLKDIYKRYSHGKTMEENGLTAHNAFSDIKATYSVFYGQEKESKYGPENMYGEDNAITDMEFLEKTQPCFNIGKYRGIGIDWVSKNDQNYLQWCVSDKAHFMNSTKEYIKQYIK